MCSIRIFAAAILVLLTGVQAYAAPVVLDFNFDVTAIGAFGTPNAGEELTSVSIGDQGFVSLLYDDGVPLSSLLLETAIYKDAILGIDVSGLGISGLPNVTTATSNNLILTVPSMTGTQALVIGLGWDIGISGLFFDGFEITGFGLGFLDYSNTAFSDLSIPSVIDFTAFDSLIFEVVFADPDLSSLFQPRIIGDISAPDAPSASVPEPGTAALMLLGLTGLARRRRHSGGPATA